MSDDARWGGPGSRFLLLAASGVVVVAGLRAASQVILPFFVSFFIAILSLPLLSWLQRVVHLRTSLAVTLTVVADILVLAAFGALLGGSINEFTTQLPKYQARLEELRDAGVSWLVSHGIEEADQWEVEEIINPGAFLEVMRTTLRGVAAVLSNTLLVLLTTIFILFEAASFPSKLRSALGRQHPGPKNFNKVTTEVQRYLVIKTVISLCTGLLLGFWVWMWGVDFAVLWGLSAFLLNYIPTLGSIIAAVPPVTLALIQFGPGRALAVLAGFLAVNVVLGNFIEPPLLGRRLGLSTLVVFLSLAFWGWVWGPVGMLLSVPLTMIIKIMLENTEDLRWIAVLLGPSPDDGRPVPLSPPGPSTAELHPGPPPRVPSRAAEEVSATGVKEDEEGVAVGADSSARYLASEID